MGKQQKPHLCEGRKRDSAIWPLFGPMPDLKFIPDSQVDYFERNEKKKTNKNATKKKTPNPQKNLKPNQQHKKPTKQIHTKNFQF